METCFSGRPVGKDPSPDPWATGGGGGEVARGSSNREVGGGDPSGALGRGGIPQGARRGRGILYLWLPWDFPSGRKSAVASNISSVY